MSRIRVELVGADNLEPRITLRTFDERLIEVLDRKLERDLPNLNVEVIVEFQIPKELNNKLKTPQSMPVFRQSLTFEAGQGARPAGHRPDGSNTGAALNPRFIPVQSSGTALGKGSLLHFRVDCRFLPMTDMARAVDPAILQSLDPNVADALRPAGTQVRLYECTVGTPRFWAVGFAPGNLPPNTTQLHAMLFLMPKSNAHSDLSSLSLFSARRYLLSPPKNHPFFVRSNDPSDPLGKSDWFTTNPNVGLLEQVLQSGKPVFLALPIPSGSAVVPSGGNFRELMRALRRALHADLLAAQAPELPGPFRVCVSGFSRGADIAAKLLTNQQSSVDEFYWSDPGTDGLSLGSQIQGWFRGNDKRRLRMIGTTLNSQLRQLVDQLKAPPERASAMPEAGFRGSAIYRAAVAVPVHTTQLTFPERFHDANDPSAPAPGSLSDATGIFLVSDNKDPVKPAVTLITRDTKNVTVNPPQKVAFTPEEVAGKARFGMLNNDRFVKPQSGVQFGERLESTRKLKLGQFVNRFLIGEILDPNNAGNGSIHQWAAVGGVGPGGAEPRNGFKGFFQICLEAADLPR